MNYDVVIIGSGVAGLTAGIYAGRANMSVLILEDSVLGGTTATLDIIENYPGFLKISGTELIQNMLTQIYSLSIGIEMISIDHIDYENKEIISNNGQKIGYKALIIASGNSYIPLDTKSSERLKFKGISYCAVCDGRLYKNKPVVVVTRGTLGNESVDYLSNLTKDIIVLDTTNLYKNDAIMVYSNVNIIDVNGEDCVESITFEANGERVTHPCSAVFVSLGRESKVKLFEDYISLKGDKIITNDRMETNIEGVFAAGDIRDKELRQIVTACADGAIAGTEAVKYVGKLNKK